MMYLFKGKYKKHFILYFVVCIFLALLIVGDSFLLQFIVANSFNGSKNFSTIVFFVAIFIILQAFGYFLQGYMSEKIIKLISSDLSENIFINIFDTKGLTNTDDDISQEIVALTTQLETFEVSYLNTILWGEYLFCQFLLAVIASLIIKPVFVIIILILSVPSLSVAILSKKAISECRKDVILNQEKFISSTVDFIQGSRNIIYFNSKDDIYIKFIRNKENMLKSQLKGAKVNAKTDMFNKFSSAILYYGIWLVGSYFIIIGNMNLAQIIAFTQLVSSISFPLHMVLGLTSDYYNGKEVKKYLEKYINFNFERRKNSNEIEFKEIAIKNLNFSVNDVKLLNNVNLSLQFNRKYVLLGESGSGKSTFVNLLFNNKSDFTGEILIDDIDIRKIDRSQLFDNIGYFPQKNYIFNNSIRENLTVFNNKIKDEDLILAIRNVGLSEWFLNKSLDDVISENSFNLSGGERQRFLLARLLLRRYKFLILDEIFTGLDKENILYIEELLSKLDIGFLVITHNSKNLLNFVDDILEIRKNNILKIN